jgi:hypothetical protein
MPGSFSGEGDTFNCCNPFYTGPANDDDFASLFVWVEFSACQKLSKHHHVQFNAPALNDPQLQREAHLKQDTFAVLAEARDNSIEGQR